MMTPEEFIELGKSELIERFESGIDFSDVSHVIRKKRVRGKEYNLLKRCLIVVEAQRNIGKTIVTSDIFITYRDLGLWLTITKDSREIKVVSIKKYKWEGKDDKWNEILGWEN